MATYLLEPSPRAEKKWRVTTPSGKTINFGSSSYQDYTTHKDYDRMLRYLSRHESREDWTADGINTAGFWSRWLLWNKPDFMESVRDIETRFGIIIDTSKISNNILVPTRVTASRM